MELAAEMWRELLLATVVTLGALGWLLWDYFKPAKNNEGERSGIDVVQEILACFCVDEDVDPAGPLKRLPLKTRLALKIFVGAPLCILLGASLVWLGVVRRAAPLRPSPIVFEVLLQLVVPYVFLVGGVFLVYHGGKLFFRSVPRYYKHAEGS